ncbi:MAG: metalloregulator ArsR/SmtB family transcription factor [Chloroflexi bacterium]|nr:metalloregulator ArsR/SmtB family transcription factor [Chloroflexota bacterium]
MTSLSFPLPSATLAARVSLAPAQNAFNSLMLLNSVGELAMRSAAVRQMVQGLTPEQRAHHRMIFDALGPALMPDEEWPSFPLYVEFLASRPPAALRDQLVDRLCAATAPAMTPEQLLGDAEAFAAQLVSRAPGAKSAAAPAWTYQAHSLLNDPPRLHDLIVSHLGVMWERALAPEWERMLPALQTLLPVCEQRMAAETTPGAMLRALTSYDAPEAVKTQLAHAPQVVFVLSGHMQNHARAARTERVLWVFFGLPPHPSLWRRSPVGQAELLVRLRALADETCLQILSLLSQNEELAAQEVMARLSLSQPNLSRHLQQLVTAGYITERRRGGAAKSYRLTPAYVAQTFQALEQFLAGKATPAAVPAPDQPPDLSPEVSRFADNAGRVVRWPSKRKDQMAVLRYLAARFEEGRNYSEKEVNALLGKWHLWNDPAFLRRELYDAHLLDRTPNGARYWRVGAEAVSNPAAGG